MEKYTSQSQKKNKVILIKYFEELGYSDSSLYHLMDSESQWQNKNSIDDLPDALLISILSLLPTKESARSSLLARRWRNLWLHTTTLNFDAPETLQKLWWRTFQKLNKTYNYPIFIAGWFRKRAIRIARNMLETERAAFVRGLNAALSSHLGQTLDEFRVSFDLDSSNSADIHRWIASALAKKVKRLELDFAHCCSIAQLYGAKYKFPNAVQNFETLVSLSLTEVHADEGVVDFFLCNCPFLEQVCLKDCSGFQSLKGECKLTSVTIEQCEDLVKLEIRSPTLASLTFSATAYNSIRVELDIGASSDLVRLSLGAGMPKLLSNWLCQISGSLANLQMLTLRASRFRQGDDEELKFPDLPKLRTLVISNNMSNAWACEGSPLCFTPLLNAAPLLHKLVVKFKRSYVRRGAARRRRYEGIRHRNLKEVVIEGLSSEVVILAEIALYVMENASSLEKLIIDGEVHATGNGLHLLKLKLELDLVFLQDAHQPGSGGL